MQPPGEERSPLPLPIIWGVSMGGAWLGVGLRSDAAFPWLVGYLAVGTAVGALLGWEMDDYYEDSRAVGRSVWLLLTGAFAVVSLLLVVDGLRA